MTDIALQWFGSHGDLVMGNTDLLTDDGLETAVLLSLCLDRRAEDDDGIALDADPRGWWGDTYADVPGDQIGSRLWLLKREKQLPSVASRAQSYGAEALAWLVDDGVASSVDVQASWTAPGQLTLAVQINRPNQSPFIRQYQTVWSAM